MWVGQMIKFAIKSVKVSFQGTLSAPRKTNWLIKIPIWILKTISRNRQVGKEVENLNGPKAIQKIQSRVWPFNSKSEKTVSIRFFLQKLVLQSQGQFWG